MENTHVPNGLYEKYIKRLMDVMLSAWAFIMLMPVMAVLALLVRIRLGSPVIFKQKRPGKNGKIFNIYKFRTMTDERDKEGCLLPDDIRLTSFGRKLRESSLDELPELINVIKGDMSLVGPRPLMVKYLPLYNKMQARRHEVLPGFTGLAQIHGRNSISWEEKFKWDVKYVDNITFLNDWKIILDTVKTVLRKDGIHAEGSVTMPEFAGTQEIADKE